MTVTVRGLAVRGTDSPSGLVNSGMPRGAASTTTSACKVLPGVTTPTSITTNLLSFPMVLLHAYRQQWKCQNNEVCNRDFLSTLCKLS